MNKELDGMFGQCDAMEYTAYRKKEKSLSRGDTWKQRSWRILVKSI